MAESLHRAARIVERTVENSKTITLRLDCTLECAPGQFAMLWLPGLDEKPFSISGSDPACFTIARVGPFSDALHALGKGDRLWFRGPFGRGYSVGSEARGGATLLVGGGYGAAPLYFLARRLLAGGGSVRVEAVLGARTASELLFPDRFPDIGVAVHPATEDGSAGRQGLATDTARALLEKGAFQRVCACGPEGMLEALSSICRANRVPAELSREAYMRCGIGLCGSCEHGGRLVCLDGPVFAVPVP